MATLVVGQTIKVRGPKGAMVYTPNMVRHFGMIAGGTGITPMLQIIRAVIRGRPTGDKTEIDLIFANVNPDDILLREDLDQLAKDDNGFRVHPRDDHGTYTPGTYTPGISGWPGLTFSPRNGFLSPQRM
jgi:cytochrome-b5 reductase